VYEGGVISTSGRNSGATEPDSGPTEPDPENLCLLGFAEELGFLRSAYQSENNTNALASNIASLSSISPYLKQ
jgi:hypothetical protein